MNELRRRANNTGRALTALQQAGANGITNIELVQRAGLRAGARVHELRGLGYGIESRDEGAGVWRYVLLSQPESAIR